MIFKWFERYPSTLFVLMAITVFGLIGGGVILQESNPIFIVPCHMCVFQRYIYIIIGIIALIAALCAKANKKSIPAFSIIILLVSAVGVYVAGTQSFMQWFPPEGAVCGMDDDSFYAFAVGVSPFKEWMPMLFEGLGDCYKAGWTFLKLSIANWSLVAYSCCVIAMILMFFKGGKGRQNLFS